MFLSRCVIIAPLSAEAAAGQQQQQANMTPQLQQRHCIKRS
jgi:hypothetical protein